MNAWVCPKCGRVWGPMVPHCAPCNNEIQNRENAKAPIIQPQHRPRTAHEDFPATSR